MQPPTVPEEGFTIQAAIWLPGTGMSQLDSAEALVKAFDRQEGIVWAHIHALNIDETRVLLEDRLHFHPLSVEDALSRHERPGLQESAETLFLEVSAVQCDDEADVYAQVSFFLGKNSLISVSIDPFPMAQLWNERWHGHPEEFEAPAFLLHSLLDGIVDDYFPATDLLESVVEEHEARLFEGEPVSSRDLLKVKRRLLHMRRRLTPIRDVINTLLRRDVTLVPPAAKPYFQDVYDHVLRLTEVVDLNRDILTGILDAQLSIASNRLSDVMRKMTVLSTLLMTGALIAGVYGMNFDVMPELRWSLGYPFAIGVMVIVAAIQLALFKWKKYI